jgi:ATP-dependent RNA circularization protein (DNA/RNA ligase family)
MPGFIEIAARNSVAARCAPKHRTPNSGHAGLFGGGNVIFNGLDAVICGYPKLERVFSPVGKVIAFSMN